MNITCLSGNHLDTFEGLSISLVESSPSLNSCLATWPFTSFSQIVFVLEGGISLILPDRGRMTVDSNHWFALSLGEWQANMDLKDKAKLVVIECPKTIWEVVVTDRDKLHHTQTACMTCSQRTEAFFFQIRMHPHIRELSAKISNQIETSPSETLHHQANILKLLALITESTSLKLPPESEPCLRSEDEEALNAAAAYLEENLSADHSLAQISRTVHLNEFKLKKGFREYHRTTVFGYLRLKRMERARALLINGRAKVIDAAQAVGYANPSHFSRAFRKTFGMNPKEFLALNKRNRQAATTEA